MEQWKEFLKEEEANGVVEVILILVVLIAMVVIFRDQLKKTITDLMKKIDQNAKKV